MTAREIFENYFKCNDEFVYMPDETLQQRFKVYDMRRNEIEMAVIRISSPNRPFTYFFKISSEMQSVYKVIQKFRR